MFHPVKRNTNAVYADPFAHIFDQFFGDVSRCRPPEAKLSTQFELSETDDEFTITAELPGIGKDNVEITVDEDILIIRGEKTAEAKVEDKSYLFSERRYGSFERKFRLPDTVKQEGIVAKHENGVLTLQLPKKPEAKKQEPRQIKLS